MIRSGSTGLGYVLLALAAVGCTTPPPTLEDRGELPSVEGGRARIYYRDLKRATAEGLLSEVAAVRSAVRHTLGFEPPRAELVLYAPGANEELSTIHETRGDLLRDVGGEWSIVFAYPYRENSGALLGTTGHEMAECTVLLRVTVIDPFLRWMHDGLADFVEHQVLLRQRPRAAKAGLARAKRFLEERLTAGDEWANLRRWRQLAPWLVRSHRFLGPSQANLSLRELPGALQRVRQAKALTQDPQLLGGLKELEAMLQRVAAEDERPYAAGEARGGDRHSRDYLFYVVSFALWLEVEQASPQAVRRYMAGLERRKADGDHVLSSVEGEALLREVCPLSLPLEHYGLERALQVIQNAERRLGQDGS